MSVNYNRQKIKRIFIFVLPLVLSAIFLLFFVYDESGDARGTSWYITQSRFYAYQVIHKALYWFTVFIQNSLPYVSWWPSLLIIFNTLCFMMASNLVTMKTNSVRVMIVLFTLLTMIVFFGLFCPLNFTRTSESLTALSTLYLIAFFCEKDSLNSPVLFCFLGMAGVVIGTMIRSQGGYLGSFAAILFYIVLTFPRLYWKGIIRGSFLVCIIFVVLYVTQGVMASEEEKSFWNSGRTKRVYDYFDNLPAYDENKEFYYSNGMESKEDILLIHKRNIPEDWAVYSEEHLAAISDSLSPVVGVDDAIRKTILLLYKSRTWRWCFVSLILLVFLHPHFFKRVLLSFSLSVCMVLAFSILGRSPARVSDGIAFTLFISIVFVLIFKTDFSAISIIKHENIVVSSLIILAIISFAVRWNTIISANLTTLAHDTEIEKRANLKAFWSEVSKDRNSIYLFSGRGGSGISPTAAFGLFEYIPDNYADNVYFLFGGINRQPKTMAELRKAGASNPMTFLLEDNVYSDYDDEVLLFLKRHYGDDINVHPVKNINGYDIVKYYREKD